MKVDISNTENRQMIEVALDDELSKAAEQIDIGRIESLLAQLGYAGLNDEDKKKKQQIWECLWKRINEMIKEEKE